MNWTRVSKDLAKKYIVVRIETTPNFARSYFESMKEKGFELSESKKIEKGKIEKHMTFLKEYKEEEDLNKMKDKFKYSIAELRKKLKDNWSKITLTPEAVTGE